jgi:polygalacturonase
MLKSRISRLLAGVLITVAASRCSIAQDQAAKPAGGNSSIADFGAVGDGKTVNTDAIQKAIDQVAANGGGTVVIPKGVFLSGAIFLKPGVALNVEKDGVLKSTGNLKDFPEGMTRIEGHFQVWVPALVNADHVDHLRIGGEGTLDGSGVPFYAKFRSTIATQRSTTNLDVRRPRMVFIRESNDVQVSGLHFLNSAFWNLHIYKCDGVKVDGIDINAAAGSPSTDGMDIDSCQHVEIANSTIANNDDCIALKGTKGPNAMEDKTSPPDEHIFIHDITIKRGPGILTCGSEATIVRDVRVEHCTISSSVGNGLTLLRLKLRPDTPEEYSDIHFNDITINGNGSLIGVAPWTQYYTSPGGPRSAHDISFTNIHGSASGLGTIVSNPGDTLERFSFSDIDLKVANAVPHFVGVKDMSFTNVKVNGNEFVLTPAMTQPAAGRGRGRGLGRGGPASAPAAQPAQ